jgi:galactose-1-phosphate uridylyltransferase
MELLSATFKYLNAIDQFPKDYVVFLNGYLASVSDKILTCSHFVSTHHKLNYGA